MRATWTWTIRGTVRTGHRLRSAPAMSDNKIFTAMALLVAGPGNRRQYSYTDFVTPDFIEFPGSAIRPYSLQKRRPHTSLSLRRARINPTPVLVVCPGQGVG